MDTLTIDLWTFDVGSAASTPHAYAELMTSRVRKSWDSGAEIVVFPEYAWMGLASLANDPGDLAQVSSLFWHEIWPSIQSELSATRKAVVLGTAPFESDKGVILNRAPVWCDGVAGYQDKIHLTPWESAFTGGSALHVFSLHGVRFAVLICLDIEIPEISAHLRGLRVDVVLVPSATENLLGVERVGRCASARAVELGCHVGVCHLLGRGGSELVDENVGCLSWFAPSQSPFKNDLREDSSPLLQNGFHPKRLVLDKAKLAAMRSNTAETNPSLAAAREDLQVVRI
jgi:predicted amidohydrolase